MSISAKIGFGTDFTTFFYTRKDPFIVYSFSYANALIPISAIWWYKSFGVSVQYNLVIGKGNATATGLNYALDRDIPNVSLNQLYLGVKFRL
jgi:hypothetical protein